jgi:hypothetical protein
MVDTVEVDYKNVLLKLALAAGRSKERVGSHGGRPGEVTKRMPCPGTHGQGVTQPVLPL